MLAAVAVASWALGDGEMVSNHVILVGWVALAHGLFEGEERTRVIWWQAVVLYLFATVNKVNPHYLSGAVLALSPVDVPLVPMSVAGIVGEGLVCLLVLRRHRLAMPLAVAVHVGIVALMGTSLAGYLMLASFNGTALLLVWMAVVQPERVRVSS